MYRLITYPIWEQSVLFQADGFEFERFEGEGDAAVLVGGEWGASMPFEWVAEGGLSFADVESCG